MAIDFSNPLTWHEEMSDADALNLAIFAINTVMHPEGSDQHSIDVGNLNYREVKGFVNLPFSDTVSTAFTVAKTDRDGYVPNIITGNDLNERDVLAYRAQVRVDASDQLEIKEQEKTDYFTGNVKVVQGTTTMRAGKMTVQGSPP